MMLVFLNSPVFSPPYVVQLLHKLSIHADDGPMKLMKVEYYIMYMPNGFVSLGILFYICTIELLTE